MMVSRGGYGELVLRHELPQTHAENDHKEREEKEFRIVANQTSEDMAIDGAGSEHEKTVLAIMLATDGWLKIRFG